MFFPICIATAESSNKTIAYTVAMVYIHNFLWGLIPFLPWRSAGHSGQLLGALSHLIQIAGMFHLAGWEWLRTAENGWDSGIVHQLWTQHNVVPWRSLEWYFTKNWSTLWSFWCFVNWNIIGFNGYISALNRLLFSIAVVTLLRGIWCSCIVVYL